MRQCESLQLFKMLSKATKPSLSVGAQAMTQSPVPHQAPEESSTLRMPRYGNLGGRHNSYDSNSALPDTARQSALFEGLFAAHTYKTNMASLAANNVII